MAVAVQAPVCGDLTASGIAGGLEGEYPGKVFLDYHINSITLRLSIWHTYLYPQHLEYKVPMKNQCSQCRGWKLLRERRVSFQILRQQTSEHMALNVPRKETFISIQVYTRA